MTDSDDDMLLLRTWREGDRRSGDALIKRYYPRVHRRASQLLGGDTEGAKELAQLTFETLLHKRDEIEKSIGAYLRRVVMLKVLAYRRHRQANGGVSELAAAEPSVESAVGSREEIKLMVKALRSLRPGDQLLLAWVYGDERTQREIAESLELSIPQCNSRISRARSRLRARLERLRESEIKQSTLGGFETWLASVHGKNPTIIP